MKKSNLQLEWLKEIQDCRFKKSSLHRDPARNLLVISREVFYSNAGMVSSHTHRIQQLVMSPSLYILPVIDWEEETVSDFCATNYRVKEYLPYPDIDLQKLLQERKLSNAFYSSEELTMLMYHLLQGCQHLESLSQFHGHLSPQWIAVTVAGYAIIEDPLFDRQMVGSVILEGVSTYACPLAYKAACVNPLLKYNCSKSDVFSVGMIILECGILNSVHGVYQRETGELDWLLLKEMINYFESLYQDNNLLCYTLTQLLLPDESSRPTASELLTRLPSQGDLKHQQSPAFSRNRLTPNQGDLEVGSSVRQTRLLESSPSDVEQRMTVPGEQENYYLANEQRRWVRKKNAEVSPYRINDLPDRSQIRSRKEAPKLQESKDNQAFFKVSLSDQEP